MADDTPRPLANLRLVVAEDEVMTMMLLEDMLEELGGTVVALVKTQDEVITAVDEHRPDAVTLDADLSGELAYRAAAELQRRDIPFVFISGYETYPDCPPGLQDCLRLKKPFRMNDLATIMRTAVDRHKRGRARS